MSLTHVCMYKVELSGTITDIAEVPLAQGSVSSVYAAHRSFSIHNCKFRLCRQRPKLHHCILAVLESACEFRDQSAIGLLPTDAYPQIIRQSIASQRSREEASSSQLCIALRAIAVLSR